MELQNKSVIHWFRKGLRLHDNPALVEAIGYAISEKAFLRPVFILDPNIPAWMKVGPNRWRFLIQSLENLNENLKAINSRLYVIRGKPEEVFKRIFLEWNVKLLTFETDIEPFSRERDARIEKIGKELNVKIIQKISHTIYNPDIVVAKNFGKPPLTYQKFVSLTEQFKKPICLAADAPKVIPNYCQPSSDSLEKKDCNCYNTPTLQELNVGEEFTGENFYPGGETEGLSRMKKYLMQKQWICKFEKPNTSPNSLEPSTTVLSPYLKFGCLSSRLFYNRLNEVIKGSTHTKPPVSLVGQLLWREFYYTVGASVRNFDKMVGNSICCQVDWDKNEQYLQAWKMGQTGYPFIDAIMRQLRTEGWIHHLARHAVACFLTRGDLWISWEEGLKVFEEYLLDADWALNAGNWMWLSASAFFHQFYRVYSPVAFGKKTDKNGAYIRKYVPELKKIPNAFIYEPWLAPVDIQRTAGCIIGIDYPKRIVIHEEIYKVNIGRMSTAYKKNKKTSEKSDASNGSSSQKGRKRKSHWFIKREQQQLIKSENCNSTLTKCMYNKHLVQIVLNR